MKLIIPITVEATQGAYLGLFTDNGLTYPASSFGETPAMAANHAKRDALRNLANGRSLVDVDAVEFEVKGS